MNPLRVLAIDGGGIRGIVPATILQAIQAKLDKPIHAYFDLVVGVSTGSIITYGITAPKSVSDDGDNSPLLAISDVISFYREKSQKIFSANTTSFMNYGFTSSKYSSQGIEGVLKEAFGDRTISQTLTPTITISYCTEHRRPIFFKSRLAKDSQHRDVRMWEACRASSAAPIYFSPYRMTVEPKNCAKVNFSLVDGGVCCNNPSVIALVELSRLYPKRPITLISLGTGRVRKPIPFGDIDNGGIKAWGVSSVDMLMSGPEDISNQSASVMINATNGSVIKRVQMDIPSDLEPMDNHANAEKLFQFATVYAKDNRSVIEDIVKSIDI